MTRMFVVELVTIAGLVATVGMAGAAEPVGRYAIVVRSDVAAGPWGKVARSLEAKYKGKGKAFAHDRSPVALCLLVVGASTATAAPPTLPAVTAPPKELGLDPFYAKYLSAHGLPVVGSSKVSDFALREAAYLADKLLDHRPEVRDAMIRNKVRLAVMAYSERTTDIPEHRDLQPKLYWNIRARGLGASRQRPAVSCAEENLLNYKGDPYSTENIMIHEFAHAIHSMGIRTVDPTFQPRLSKVYKDAKAKGLWKDTYAVSNISEYWAEGVQSWFDTNRQNDSSHNHVDTRAELKSYDPALAKLVEEVFGDGTWRYVRPDRRPDLAESHLAGYEPGKGPKFQWEPELLEARRKNSENVDRSKRRARPTEKPERKVPEEH